MHVFSQQNNRFSSAALDVAKMLVSRSDRLVWWKETITSLAVLVGPWDVLDVVEQQVIVPVQGVEPDFVF